MYTEKFEKIYSNFKEKYYKKDCVIKKRKKLSLKNDYNNIAIIKLPKICEEYNKTICWYITSMDIKFERIYIITPDNNNKDTFEDFKFKQVCAIFSDIIEVIETNKSNKIILDLINENKNNDIFILNPDIIYNNLTIPYHIGKNIVYNLHYDINYTKKHSFYKSCIQYNKNDDTEYNKNTLVIEPDIRNFLLSDFYIPAYLLKNFIFNEEISVESNIYYYCFMNDVKIYHLQQNIFNVDFNVNLHDSELLSLINNEKEQFKIDKWYYNYPHYKSSELIITSINKTIDLAFVSITYPELIIESILNLTNNYNFNIRNIFILDNVIEKHFELHMYKHHENKIKSFKNIKILYNNINQLFERTLPSKEELYNNKKFGETLFNESVNYLIKNSTSDYLIVLNDKILLNDEISFDPNIIWNKNEFYINVFNLSKMKKMNIEFENLIQFNKEVEKSEMKKNSIKKHIILPYDFDKYSSDVFRVSNIRGQLLYNYLIDKYNYRLVNYEEYNGSSI